MTKETIRDWTGKILGFIETDNEGKKTVRKFSGEIVGFYYPKRNVTTDFSGRMIAQGDCSSGLLLNH